MIQLQYVFVQHSDKSIPSPSNLVNSSSHSDNSIPSPSNLVNSSSHSDMSIPSPLNLVNSSSHSDMSIPSPSNLVNSLQVTVTFQFHHRRISSILYKSPWHVNSISILYKSQWHVNSITVESRQFFTSYSDMSIPSPSNLINSLQVIVQLTHDQFAVVTNT